MEKINLFPFLSSLSCYRSIMNKRYGTSVIKKKKKEKKAFANLQFLLNYLRRFYWQLIILRYDLISVSARGRDFSVPPLTY